MGSGLVLARHQQAERRTEMNHRRRNRWNVRLHPRRTLRHRPVVELVVAVAVVVVCSTCIDVMSE